MIGRLLRLAVAGAVYFCIATILAQTVIVGYLAAQGRLSRERLVQLASILQGIDLLKLRDDAQARTLNTSTEQVSLQDVAQARAAKLRDLELREQALQRGIEQLEVRRQQLTQELADFQAIRSTFEEQLAAQQSAALLAGEENVRQIMSGIKAKQAKELLLEMLAKDEMDQVVSLLLAMPTQKKTKIVAEFKSPDEAKKLDEILRRMRSGQPTTDLVDVTRSQLGQTPASQP